jgi:hypothetical protein
MVKPEVCQQLGVNCCKHWPVGRGKGKDTGKGDRGKGFEEGAEGAVKATDADATALL